MTIGNLISKKAPPLRANDTVEFALSLLMELRVSHLPVVDSSGKLIGIVSEDTLLDADGPEVLVGQLVEGDPVSATVDQHVFDATRIMVKHDLTTLPVLDRQGRLAGIVKRHEILDKFARMLSTHEAGAILALEVHPSDFSLSKLVYSIEQADVKILSIATEAPSEKGGMIAITLKLNSAGTTRIRHVLEHQGYRIVASFSDEYDEEELRHRVQEFMRYLEV